MEDTVESIQGLWNIVQCNICVIEIPEVEDERERERQTDRDKTERQRTMLIPKSREKESKPLMGWWEY